MKAGNCWKWRPAMGVLVAGALAFAVSVQGGPRVTDGKTALNKGRAKSDTARLVTGSSPVVAGTEKAFIALTPVYLNADGNPYNQAATGAGYTGANISGQVLTVNAGGFRAFFHVEGGSWDSTMGSGVMVRSTQARIDSKTFQGANAVPPNPGCDILQLTSGSGKEIPCANTGVCIAAFNSVGAPKCGDAISGICNWGWINVNKAPHYDGKQWVHSNIFGGYTADWGLTSPSGPLCFSSSEPSEPRVDDKYPAPYYFGTLALWVPECAAGTYTLDFVASETFLADADSVVLPDLGVPVNFILPQVTIPVGRCCYGIGTGGAGCIDDVTKTYCDNAAQPAVWSDTQTCVDPCADCLIDTDCNDGDACTVDTCDGNLICHNDPIPAWDQATECCDAVTGAMCVPTPDNVCQTAACSIAPNRGVCVNTSIPEGDPCTGEGDDNPCTFWDICAADESCSGTDVNASMIPCVTDQDCADATKGLTAPTCVSGICDCSLVPDLTVQITPSGKKDDNCFDSGDPTDPTDAGAKVTATVRVAAATAAINGGQFLIEYDPTCLDYISAAGVAPYTDAVYGPIVNEGAGEIFIVVGVGFGAGDGPAGNANMLALSFEKVGDCDSCQICFSSNNPENTYLVDNTGQRIGVNPICSKAIKANGDVQVVVPKSQRNLNVDCDQPTKVVTWDWPYATDTCGEATISCWGEHEGGGLYGEAMAMKGGELPIGISNFCCYAESNWCGDWDGCAPGMDCPATPSEKEGFYDVDGCWTVDINDETSLDIELQLSPTVDAKPGTDLTRCIKFTLYPNTIQEPMRFFANVEFGNTVGGAMMDHVGKVKDKIKIPGHDQWDCISAWDQLHTLRACYLFGPDDCFEGQLNASFTGDPLFGGNWLIGGNLDGWKKDVDGAEPSLFVIDILDYGTFVAEWEANYGTGDTPCGTPGPHADIDGDGDVDLDDYAYIQMNFLVSAKMCCGVDGLPAAAMTEISVRELREMGRGELAVADLNGDGMLDMSDMDAFMQGARPVTKGSRTGTR